MSAPAQKPATTGQNAGNENDADARMYVTMRVDNQMFGVDVKNVRDVLRHQKITPIPLAPPEVAGSLNLRGRIVTVINLRRRLGLPVAPTQVDCAFVVIELKGELYSLMVDNVSEVLTIPSAKIEKTPANIGTAWKDIATGIHKLPGELLVLVEAQSLIQGYDMPSCLIVDDSKIVRKLERRIMEELGFSISEAEDGQKALEYCQAQKPDLILLDWHMPVMDGLAFLIALRAMPDGKVPKVLFCTTETDPSHIMQAITNGADEYVMKPFDSAIIKGKLEQIGMV